MEAPQPQTTQDPSSDFETSEETYWTGGSTSPTCSSPDVQPAAINNKRQSKIFRRPSALSTKTKLFFGLVIVLVIASSWVGSTQTAKSTLTSAFKVPYFVMWFGTCWMVLVFPLAYLSWNAHQLYLWAATDHYKQTGHSFHHEWCSRTVKLLR